MPKNISTGREPAFAVKRALAASAIALCGAGSMGTHAQQAGGPQTTAAPAGGNPAGVAQLQTVIVTGSLISRTDLETPNPVQVLSAKSLVESGYTDMSGVLSNLSANGASTLSQSFSNAFATGAAGVSLRGLTVGDTLVLIDGERSVPYPLLDDNQRSFVDMSSIPFMAVQEVQVDKNGASAVYGSDAIAGVVNVLLKKQYQGLDVSAEAGSSEHGDATLEHFGFIGGRGDLAADGYNWYIAGEFRHQDQILAAHRHGLWDNLDWTPWGGTFGGAASLGASPLSQPIIAFPQSTTGYFIDPASGNVVNYLPGCDAQAQKLNRCLAILPGAQLQPPTTRVDVIGKFTKQLAGNWQFGVQASWFDSSSEAIAGYSPGVGNVAGVSNIAFGPGVPPHVVPASSLITPNIITVPSSNPMYPACTTQSWCGSPLAFQYAFPEIGPAATYSDANTYRLLASLNGDAAGWNIDASAGAMYSRLSLKITGQINWQDLQAALDNGYVFGSSGATNLVAPVEETTPFSELDLLDVHGTHTLFQLPGGPLDLAIGVQYYKKVQDEHAPPAAEAGLQTEGGGPVYVIGTEKDAAAFAELDGKPIRQLEVDAALRYDDYQTFGGATTPQIGVKFTPVRMVALRGTYGKGFRAPSAAEGGESAEVFGAGAFRDPVLCPTTPPPGTVAGPGDFANFCTFGVAGLQTANPHLQNVKSTNWTAGIVLEPVSAASVSLDYYNVKVTNDIISAFEAGGLSNFSGILRGAPLVQPTFCPPANTGGCTASQLVTATTPVGSILELTFPYVNAGSTHTSGFDLDLKTHYDAGAFGRLTAEATWTHLLTYQLTFAGSTFELAGTHGPSGISGDTGSPKDRASLQVSWQRGPLTIAPSLDYVGHFSITDPSSGVTDCAGGLGFFGRIPSPNGVTPATQGFCNVGYYLQTDLYGSYQVTEKLQVHGSVTNVFNKQPPVDIQTYGSGTYFYSYDAAFHQGGAVGRFFTLGAVYEF